jgi:RimJ/RimL family protein N-acetyltransferase
VTLPGKLIQLVPLAERHIPDLARAGQDETIWRYFNMPVGWTATEANMAHFVRELVDRQARGIELPFAVVLRETGRAVGMIRYADIDARHRSLEVGGAWYGTPYQRTGVNTECRYLILGHAFEALGCLRVQFKADLRNERPLRALERIGAVREGVLRQHMIMPDGHRRDSVIFSILDREWPAVKALLERLMAR